MVLLPSPTAGERALDNLYLTLSCPSSCFLNPSPTTRVLIVSSLPINGLLPKHLPSGTSQLLPSAQRLPEYSFQASISFSSSPSLPGNISPLACPLPHLLFSILHPLVLWLPNYAQAQGYANGINWNQILDSCQKDNSQILKFYLKEIKIDWQRIILQAWPGLFSLFVSLIF